jgi:small conductance mechanosensitive channel
MPPNGRPPNGRRRRRFLKGAGGTLAALIGSVVADFGNIYDPGHRLSRIVPTLAGSALLLLGGSVAVRAAASAVKDRSIARVGRDKGVSVAKTVAAAGYVLVTLWTLSALGVRLQALLLGGALTGVVLGIAAQQTLGNVFAGMVLLVVKPFTVGEDALLKSSLGEYRGRITNIGFFYVTIQTKAGQVDVPNAVALGSAVGPGAVLAPEEDATGESGGQSAAATAAEGDTREPEVQSAAATAAEVSAGDQDQ